MPHVTAPALEINDPGNGVAGGSTGLSVSLIGGDYDAGTETYSWSVSHGSLSSSSASGPTWSFPGSLTAQVLAEASVSVGVSKDGHTASNFTNIRIFITPPSLPVARAPTGFFVRGISRGNTGTTTGLSVSHNNDGLHDRLTYSWSVSGGSLSRASPNTPNLSLIHI